MPQKVCSPLIAAESGVMGLAQRWYETEVIYRYVDQATEWKDLLDDTYFGKAPGEEMP